MKFISSTKTPIQTGRKLLRPKSPLRRLEWKLTGLFVLASTFTAALVHLILFGAIMLALFSKNVLPNELVEALKSHEAQARSYFAGDKPDIQGLTRLLDQAILNTGTEAEGFQFVSYAASTGVMTAAIGDGSGNILVASPVQSPFPIGRPLESALLPGEVAYLNEARNGKVVAGWVNGSLVAAGRITRHQKVVGLAFLRSGVMLNGWKTWGPITADFFATLIFTALVTLPVGALVGKVFAKRITNRLSGISVTADRWAKGDLSVTASEQPSYFV